VARSAATSAHTAASSAGDGDDAGVVEDTAALPDGPEEAVLLGPHPAASSATLITPAAIAGRETGLIPMVTVPCPQITPGIRGESGRSPTAGPRACAARLTLGGIGVPDQVEG
jgi:hypothetical protein